MGGESDKTVGDVSGWKCLICIQDCYREVARSR